MLETVHEIAIYIHRFHNLDLFQQGSKLSLYSSRREKHMAASTKKVHMSASTKDAQKGTGTNEEEEYMRQSKLLKEFINIPSIDKGWVFNSEPGSNISQAIFSITQPNLFANKKRMMLLSSNIRASGQSVNFLWSAFPVEMIGVSAIVPSPSGSKLLVVRNKDDGSPTLLEIWDHFMLQKEISIPETVHGSLYTEQWFEGISWNKEENLVAYVAEEPSPPKPAFDDSGFKGQGIPDTVSRSWKGQGYWEEHWGETYSAKTKPSLYVVNTESGEVRAVDGIARSLSVGQVVWAPSLEGCPKHLVFVGWESENSIHHSSRKLGIKYCYNRPCSLYAVRSPFQESVPREKLSTADINYSEVASNLTPSMRSAFFPRFSPNGRFLVFCSAQAAVDSGAHCATNSLHRIDWLPNEPGSSFNIFDVVPVVQCPENDCFPGLYCSSILSHPWLSDGSTMMLCSYWGSTQVILSIDTLSCKISRVTPADCDHSWNILALDGDNILSVCSSPVDPPEIKYGYSLCLEQKHEGHAWHWLDINCTSLQYSEKVKGLLSSHKFRILKIPVCDGVTKGTQTFESIFISSDSQANGLQEQNQKTGSCNPLIVILHGGPHSVSLTSYSKSLAFLASLGYNLLIVNYRGSLGFGEEALQSLPGSIGIQDVNDVLAALDYVIQMGLADKSRVAVLGGSHGGFLTTHLIGQAPDRFVAAAARNPVCNLALMVGTTDIPDWCFVETYGAEGKSFITEAPTSQNLDQFLSRSPIAHLPKVKAPTLFLLGAQDLRVPISNGLQYARALKEKGSEVKVIVFPEDIHGIERPQSDFESFLNIGVWFRKYCK